MCRYVFKLLAVLIILAACSDIDRDNLLDPKNDSSYREAKILIESFVTFDSSGNPAPYNESALKALNEVEATFEDELIIIEYHRDVAHYNDSYNTNETNTLFSDLHRKYVDQYNLTIPEAQQIPRGVPDIFINGTDSRISGADVQSGNSVTDRLVPVITARQNEKSYFTIEAQVQDMGNNTYNLSGKIAPLGNQPADDLLLKVVFIKNFGSEYLRRVALNLDQGLTIDHIDAGEFKAYQLDPFILTHTPNAVILILTSADEFRILQTYKMELHKMEL